ncbi:MAG: HlyD family secretion protein, partial [Sphingomonadaceae bacterium]
MDKATTISGYGDDTDTDINIDAAPAAADRADNGVIEETPEEAAIRKGRRKKLFVWLAVVVLVLGGLYLAYDWMFASRQVETDNAYVGADVAQVTPLVGGPVLEVLVDDTRHVRRGDILIRLDDTDARIALAQAEANLAQTERRVRGLIATDSGLGAQIASRAADEEAAKANLAAARSELQKSRIDYDRRSALAASGSVSGEELTTARNARNAAEANVAAAQAMLAQARANRSSAIGTRDANRALISGSGVADNPEVVAARAALEQAQVNLERTEIRAPIDGVISKRQVQVGQRVQAGQALMAVVPVQAAYV